jgi:hypothetical protein
VLRLSETPILELERAMRRPPAGILIQGLGGIGKTTLARGFVQWLAATDGVGEGCFWFGFGEIRSAEFVCNRLGEALFGGQFAAAALDKKIERLAKMLKEHAFLIVWDNFEVVQGIAGTAVEPAMPEPDRRLLFSFLQKLRGGSSTVLITSRSEEEWLGVERVKISLEGLQGEERWEYCERILGELGISIDREDHNLIRLMNLLAGHPLAMRLILPKLEKRTATDVVTALTTSGDEAQDKLYATLKFAEQSLPGQFRPLLTPLALHEGFLDANDAEQMAHQAIPGMILARVTSREVASDCHLPSPLSSGACTRVSWSRILGQEFGGRLGANLRHAWDVIARVAHQG